MLEMSANIKVSVITIVYNGENFIDDCISSVLNQDYPFIEYIIIDGGSTDGTMRIVDSYGSLIHRVISEKDNGIADAFNKGLLLSTGDLVGFLNSDDFYETNVISRLVNYIKSHDLLEVNSPQIFYGQTNEVNRISGIKRFKKDSRIGWWLRVPFSHCSSFVNRSYVEKLGIFNTKFKIAMDIDFLFKIHKKSISKVYNIGFIIANQRNGGISDVNAINGYIEYWKISKLYYGYILSSIGLLIKCLLFIFNKLKFYVYN